MADNQAHIAFVTPAHGRLAVSEVCLSQRALALEQLRVEGFHASSIVVACDENLDLAGSLGMETVEVDNEYLGRRWNAGYARAHELGATHVCPVGSDSMLDPAWIVRALPVPKRREIVFSRHYAMVRQDGAELACLYVDRGPYGTSFCFPTAMLERLRFEPVDPLIARGCDSSTFRNLRKGGQIRMVQSEVHEFDTLSLRSEVQISDYGRLVNAYGRWVSEDPWSYLEAVYPASVVDAARSLYAKVPVAA